MMSTIVAARVPRGGLAGDASGSRKRVGPAFSRARTSRAVTAIIHRISSEKTPKTIVVKNVDMRGPSAQ